jgi:NAD(P)-dependent dehydrogenase (short-subunit alcohol dehydrogenase family)
MEALMSELVPGVAVVTGGGSGIGRAIALALAEAGAPVGVLDLLPEGGQETVDQIAERGGKAVFAQADVSQWPALDQAVSTALFQLGPLGIFVNAAGILDGYTQVEELSPDLWNRVIAINLTGTFYGCKRALVELQPAGRGRIVNIASTAGVVGDGGGAAYIASKHGVVGLTRQLGVANASNGLTVNAICPGPIQTGLREHSGRILGQGSPDMSRGIGGSLERLRAIVPAGRYGTADEVAALARFLCSEAAAYITGQTLVIDGGWVAR